MNPSSGTAAVTGDSKNSGCEPFEGVEKKLTLRYRCVTGKPSIRTRVDDGFWRQMVKAVKAEVLSVIRNDYIDAYLLSESSLFVFDDQVILKTCGKTRIFNALELIANRVSSNNGLELVEIVYSRPSFIFPELQPGVYGDFDREAERLTELASKLASSWTANRRDHSKSPGPIFHTLTLKNSGTPLSWRAPDSTADLAMFKIRSTLTLKEFFRPSEDARNIVVRSGLSKFLPTDSETFIHDDFLFEPCGYSLNAIDGHNYWSIHISPEERFSYISFETNSSPSQDLLNKIRDHYDPVNNVLLIDRAEGAIKDQPPLAIGSSLFAGFVITSLIFAWPYLLKPLDAASTTIRRVWDTTANI